jgi:hypothetical protein
VAGAGVERFPTTDTRKQSDDLPGVPWSLGPIQKLKAVAWSIFSPSGLGLPVFLILSWPVLLSWIWVPRYISYMSLLAGYVKVLLLTLAWAGVPVFFLLRGILANELSSGFVKSVVDYIIPLIILSTIIYWVLARKLSKLRALWLALAWSVFLLQVTGSIPMAYLWYMGV